MNSESDADPYADANYEASPLNPREDAENPYLSPSQLRDAESATMQPISTRAPWAGGWPVVTAAVFMVVLAIVGIGSSLTPGWFTVIVLPTLGLGGLALLIRHLHSVVRIGWPAYLITSFLFAVASYVLFVPVCIVVGLPVMFTLENMSVPGVSVAATLAIFATLMVVGMLFSLFLRSFLQNRWRHQMVEDSILWGPVGDNHVESKSNTPPAQGSPKSPADYQRPSQTPPTQQTPPPHPNPPTQRPPESDS